MADEPYMEKGKYIVWHKDYSVENEMLDTQHKGIFNVINTLYDGISSETGHADIRKTIRYLRLYAEIHFREEEKAMQACGYPELFAHRTMHLLYAKKVDYFAKQLQKENMDISYSVMKFLRGWWKFHVLRVDQKYVPYLKSPKGEEYARRQAEQQKREKVKYERRREERQQELNETQDSPVVNDEKYYAEILDLPNLITKGSIKKAYFQKIKEYHPDRVATLGPKIRDFAEAEMRKINEAFDFFEKKYGPI